MSTLTIQSLDPPSDKDPYEVNVVQSTDSSKSFVGNQKKGKGKQKQNNARIRKKLNFPTDDSPNHKPKFPCLICGKYHFTKDFPHCVVAASNQIITMSKRTNSIGFQAVVKTDAMRFTPQPLKLTKMSEKNIGRKSGTYPK